MSLAQKRAYDRESYVLVVDDDNTLLKFFKIHLNKFFSRVIVVENAKEAQKAMKEKNIDLLITDVRMPKTDGLQLVKKVRRKDPTIPCLLISGEIMSPDQEDQVQDSEGFLRKPFGIEDLHEFINYGMTVREHYQKIAPLLKDTKNVRSVAQGKMSPGRTALPHKADELETHVKALQEVFAKGYLAKSSKAS